MMPTPVATAPPGERPRVDGRRLRAVATRERLIKVTRDWMWGSQWQPPVLDIARAANVSTRSIFQHFNCVGELYAAALIADEPLAQHIARRVLPPSITVDDGYVCLSIAHAVVTGRPLVQQG